ncbi:MAG: hypothetical protein ABI354_01680 [Candidatus Saccharimonadales bacterium]
MGVHNSWMDYWDLFDGSNDVAKQTYSDNLEIFDPAIEAWNSFNLLKIYNGFYHDSTIFVTYRIHMDKSLRRAISSCTTLDYDQALYNLRLAVEYAGITLFVYGDFQRAKKIFEDGQHDGFDTEMRKASIDYLKINLPEISERLRGLHTAADQFGSHQSIALHGNYISFSEGNKFRVVPLGSFSTEMTVGICGIIMGVILEVQLALESLPAPQWIKLGVDLHDKLDVLQGELNTMQKKYRYLYK